MAKHTKKTPEILAKDTDRDNFMSSGEAIEYGIVDQVLQTRASIEIEE